LFNLYLLRLGYGPVFVGQVNAIGSLAFALASLPASFIGSRFGNRRSMILGLFLSVIGHGLVSQAGFVPAADRQLYILSTQALGLLGISLYIVNGFPYLMDVAKPADRTRVFSIQAALFPLAGFAGSLIGGFLPGRFSALLNLPLDHPTPYSHTMLAASILLIVAVIALLRTRKIVQPAEEDAKQTTAPLPFRLIALYSCISLLFIASEGAVRTFFNVYLDKDLKIETSIIGILTATGQFLAAPAALLMPYLVKRFGNILTFNSAVALSALSMIPLALIPHWSIAGLCFMCTMALAANRQPAFTVFQQESIPPRWRTTMAGAAATTSGFGYAIIAFGGGYIIETVGYRSLFLGSAAISVLGVLVFWACNRPATNRFCVKKQT
jgi:MFS family permease